MRIRRAILLLFLVGCVTTSEPTHEYVISAKDRRELSEQRARQNYRGKDSWQEHEQLLNTLEQQFRTLEKANPEDPPVEKTRPKSAKEKQ